MQHTLPEQPVRGGTITMALFASPNGLFNPLLTMNEYDVYVNAFIYQSLLYVDDKLQVGTRLAREYSVSPDHRVYRVILREHVRWHDGTPLTIDDVIFTIETSLHPDYRGPLANSFLDVQGAKAYKAGVVDGVAGLCRVSDFELTIELEQPSTSFLHRLLLVVVPKHIFAHWPVDRLAEHPASSQPIGCGPYRFSRFKPNDHVELVANDDYFLGRPHTDPLELRVADQSQAMTLVAKGLIDYTYGRPEDVVPAEASGYAIYEYPSLSYQFLGINHRHALLRDRCVRQALAYAVNRTRLVETLLAGHGTVINSHFVPLVWTYDETSLKKYHHDPAMALQLLQQAGLPVDRMLNEEPLRLTMACPLGNEIRERSAYLIQQDLRTVGIEVELEFMPFHEFSKRALDRHEFDLWLLLWRVSLEPDPSTQFLSGVHALRGSGWSSAYSDELIHKGRLLTDRDERRCVYQEWARFINDELPHVFLYTQNEIQLVNKRLRGLRPDPRGALWNIHEIWIPSDAQ